MHDIDPVFRGWSRSPKVAALMRRMGFLRPLPVQSMYILKVRAFLARSIFILRAI